MTSLKVSAAQAIFMLYLGDIIDIFRIYLIYIEAIFTLYSCSI